MRMQNVMKEWALLHALVCLVTVAMDSIVKVIIFQEFKFYKLGDIFVVLLPVWCCRCGPGDHEVVLY